MTALVMDIPGPTTLVQVHFNLALAALAVVPLAVMVKKGERTHRLAGFAFLAGCAVLVPISAMVAYHRGDPKTALLALLVAHLAFGGWRSLYLKRLHQGLKPRRPDKLLHGGMGVLYTGAFFWGITDLMLAQKGQKADPLLPLLGAVGLLLVSMQFYRFFKSSHDKHDWLHGHGQGMIMAWAFLLAAFSMMHLPIPREIAFRLAWPVLLVLPLVMLWTRRMRKRLTHGKRASHFYRIRIK